MTHGGVMPRLQVEHLSDAAVARAITQRTCLALGLDRHRAAEAALVASELSTNMVKHAGRGELSLEVEPGACVLWIVARDRGPGLDCTEHLFRDGVSHGGVRAPDTAIQLGLGSGGGALKRLSTEVRVRAREGGGTEIRCSVRL